MEQNILQSHSFILRRNPAGFFL